MKRTKERRFRIADCPKCHQFIFEDNHLRCIIPYTRQTLKTALKDLFENNQDLIESEYEKIYEALLPIKEESFPSSQYYDSFWRSLWMEEFLSYSLMPNWEILIYLKNLIKNETVLEIGAGVGLYAYLLKLFNISIYTTDSYKEMDSIMFYRNPDQTIFTFTDVEKLEASEAIKKYDNVNVLLIIWLGRFPTYEDLKNFKGNKVIIIGHASHTYRLAGVFDLLCYEEERPFRSSLDYKILNEWKVVETQYIPSWFGLEESIYYIERIQR